MNKCHVILLLILSSGLLNGQSYDDYNESYYNDLSFEAKKFIHDPEIKILNDHIKDNSGIDIILLAINNLLISADQILDEIAYLDTENYSGNDLRICTQDYNLLTGPQQLRYKNIINYLENNFAISLAEYNNIKHKIQVLKPIASYSLNQDLTLLEEYIDLAFNLKYSKLEIYRDFSGYWTFYPFMSNIDPLDLISSFPNWPSYNVVYPNPLNITGEREHGLGATEAIRRLRDISRCMTELGLRSHKEDSQIYLSVQNTYLDIFLPEDLDQNIKTFHIYNTSGLSIFREHEKISSTKYRIRIDNLSNQIYFLVVYVDNKQYAVEKFFPFIP